MSPIFEYECSQCGFRFERIELTEIDELPECPRCTEEWQKTVEMQKMISVPADPHFVGEGWTRPSNYHNAPQGTHPIPGPKKGRDYPD